MFLKRNKKPRMKEIKKLIKLKMKMKEKELKKYLVWKELKHKQELLIFQSFFYIIII